MNPMIAFISGEVGGRLSDLWGPVREFLKVCSGWFKDRQFDFLLFFAILALTFLVAAVAGWFMSRVLVKLAGKTSTKLDNQLIDAVNRPFVILLTISGIACGIGVIRMPSGMLDAVFRIYYAAATLLVVWGLLRVIEVFNVHFKVIAARSSGTFDNLLIDLLRRVAKVSIWIIALLFIAQNIFSLNVSAMLAGAGVAGLAIAFAAQNTIANIFGAVTLVLDKAFSIGDRIAVGDKDGIVEGIGLRSTRIRSLDGTLWTIPNREMADGSIRNFSLRPSYKYVFGIGLVYNTPEEKMRRAVALLHEILDGRPCFDMENFPPRIYFSDFKDWSLNITVIVWFQTVDYFEMMSERENMNAEILKRFNAEGLEFAFPSTTNYLAGDTTRPILLKK